MADEELRELADINLSHQYGGGRWGSGGGGGGGGSWGRSPGGGGPPPGGGSLSHHRVPPPQHHSTRAAEAEDIMGRGGPGGGSSSRGRSGLYYSPPGTSYTIVERPAPKHPRGTYLGSSSTFSNNSRTPASSKKRPISPEQVLKMFGHNNNMKTPEIHPGSRRPSPIPHMEQLTVRTVNMSRGQQPDSHGFGICVKGGSKDADPSSVDNEDLLYKSILKPMWTYGIQLWDTASKPNIAILQRFQNKVLRAFVDAPYYVSNEIIQHDIPLEFIQEVIRLFSVRYSERVLVHPNVLANQLNVRDANEVHRLNSLLSSDLTSGSR